MKKILNLFWNRWPIKVLCIALAVVLYFLYRVNTLAEEVRTVPLRILTAEGFVVSSDFPPLLRVTLRGEKEFLDGIVTEDIQAVADLTVHPEDGQFRVPVEIRKKGTALNPDALEIRPQIREITLSQERRTIRSIAVQPQISGFPALGYELTQYFVSPSTVTVVGPRSQMTEIEMLSTEVIDLSGRRNDFTVTKRLVKPSDQILLPGGDVVEFRGVVDEAVIIRTIADKEIVVLDLSPAFRLSESLPTVSLTLQGSQLAVEGATPQDMTFYIDGSVITGPGIYTLPLNMDIPSGLAVLQLLPREVKVTVLEAE